MKAYFFLVCKKYPKLFALAKKTRDKANSFSRLIFIAWTTAFHFIFWNSCENKCVFGSGHIRSVSLSFWLMDCTSAISAEFNFSV